MNTEKETLSTEEEDSSELIINLRGDIISDINRLKMGFGYEDYQSVIAHVLHEYKTSPIEAQQDLFYWLSLTHSVLDSLMRSILKEERIIKQEKLIGDMQATIESQLRTLAREIVSD